MTLIQDTIDRAKAEFSQAADGLRRALATVPEDRLTWSPSPTSRSPLRVAAHAAFAVGHMLGNMKGDTFAIPTTEEAEQFHRAQDATIQTREEALKLLQSKQDAYFEWLDKLDPETLAATMKLPFGMGEMPTHAAIPFMALHLQWHTAQIDYIQTIYGDLDWHMPS